jgi:selenocysteine lyase/cysteine desulfurase
MALPDAYLSEFDEGFGYLDFASAGPPSRRVVGTVAENYRRLESAVGTVAAWAMGAYEAALGTAARFLGVAPEQVTAVPSTSAGLFQVAMGLVGAGGNVVVPEAEFPANLYPWLRAEALGGPEVRRVTVPDGRVTAAALSQAVDDETRAVAVSLVDFLTGFRPDLAELRELADDALLVVDAAQGLGAVAQALAPADVMVSTGMKWLRAGWGSGLLAVSPIALERLEPALTGWFGVEGFLDFDVPVPHPARNDAERLREGAPGVLGALACAAAIDTIELAGISAIEGAIRARARELEDVVRAAGADVTAPWRGDGERAGILSFALPDEPATETVQRLAAAGLTVSRRGGWIRLSPHATSDPAVASALAEAL